VANIRAAQRRGYHNHRDVKASEKIQTGI